MNLLTHTTAQFSWATVDIRGLILTYPASESKPALPGAKQLLRGKAGSKTQLLQLQGGEGTPVPLPGAQTLQTPLSLRDPC